VVALRVDFIRLLIHHRLFDVERQLVVELLADEVEEGGREETAPREVAVVEPRVGNDLLNELARERGGHVYGGGKERRGGQASWVF
jgi:hypothetical protein